MVKILFLLSNLSGGGAQRVVLTIINHLNRRFFNPSLLLLNNDRSDYSNDIPSDINVYTLKANRARYTGPELCYFLWKYRPDVIFSTLDYMNILVMVTNIFLLYRPKVVVREIFLTKQDFLHTRYPSISTTLRTFLYKNVSKVICQSDSIRNDLMRSFNLPSDKIVRIYNPVDVKGIKEKATIIPNPYNTNVRNIIAIGRLCYQKGFDLLIPALAKIKSIIPDIHLTILGRGEDMAQLQRIVSQLNLETDVTFAGFLENPYPYLWNADLFVLPSRFEGLSNALLEALACGVPVVAADASGGTKEVIQNGVNGWLIRSEDVDALADGIQNALSTPLALDRENLRRSTENEFGIQVILSQYETVLHDLSKVL